MQQMIYALLTFGIFFYSLLTIYYLYNIYILKRPFVEVDREAGKFFK
jgi:hypothetical protein